MKGAHLVLDPAGGEIRECNAAAAALLGADAAALRGRRWPEALGCDDATREALAVLFNARRPVSLPAFPRRDPGGEVILGGLVVPADDGLSVQLWPVFTDDLAALSPAATDTLAVIGVDRLPRAGSGAAAAIYGIMAALRDSLLEVVRGQDRVSGAFGTSLVVVLRDLDVEDARDISRALLSHLHRLHTGQDGVAGGARIRAGLARCGPDRGAVATLWAANNALLRVQAGGVEKLGLEREDDFALLADRALLDGGAFGGVPAVAAQATAPRRQSAAPDTPAQPPPVQPIEKDIEGYVVDNMEGAVDQAMFLAHLDIPVAIVGPAGTGKMYVAKIIHEEAGGRPESMVTLDCKEFRNRGEANKRIARELEDGEGRTLVFKSPHLMHAEAQQRLARQVSSRTLADASPPRALPRVKLLALFPLPIEDLVRRGELNPSLASAFGGYPIHVPPIRDRKQAVLRWAHKILGQEGALRDRDMRGFTPDAERALLLYDWPGNISEMRGCIADALDKTDKDWLSPVDLGLFTGIEAEGTPQSAESRPFLAAAEAGETDEEDYEPTALESLDVALAEAVHSLLELDLEKPLGAWLEDEVVLAALERYRGDQRRAADFLHTRPRNISRWLPKIESREEERNGSALWQDSRRLLREWVRELPQQEQSPLKTLEARLIARLEVQAASLSAGRRSRIMGVSTPTYMKRVREATEA